MKLPVLGNDYKSITWYDVTKEKAAPCAVPNGFAKPSVAQLRLLVDENDGYAGVMLNADGSMKFIEESSGFFEKMNALLKMKFRISFREGKLNSGAKIYDVVLLGVKCKQCGRIKKPIDFVDLSNRETWGMICGSCRTDVSVSADI